MNELIDVVNERCLDVLCVTETKRKGSDTEDIPGGMMALWSGVEQDGHASAGVGVVLSSRLANGVKDYSLVSPRLLWIRIKRGITRVFLVAAYAPVSSACIQDLEAFWDSVKETLDLAEGNERVIMCGDLNGWVGTKRDGYEAILGPYGDKRVNDAGKDPTIKKALSFSKRLQTMKHWYSRISWANKKRYILALLEDVRSAWALSWLLKSMWNCRPKDAIISANEPRVWSSYDQVPMDHNRTAQPVTTLAQVMRIDRAWFLNLEPQVQAMVLIELLSISGGPVMWEVLKRAQSLYEGYRNDQLQDIQKCVVVNDALSEKSASATTTDKNKKDIQEKQTSGRHKSNMATPDRTPRSAQAAPGSAQAQLDANLAIWKSTIKSMRDSLKLEELEMIFIDGSKRKIWKVNRPRPEAIETVDFIQLLPSTVGKKILSYLPRAQLGDYARVNKYWAFLVDDFKAELAARQKIDIELEKLKDHMLLHDKSMEVLPHTDEETLSSPNLVNTSLSIKLKTTEPSMRASEKSAGVFSFRHFVHNNLNSPGVVMQRPLKNMVEFIGLLDRRGAADENIWNWCNNVLKITKHKKRKQNIDEGVIPRENVYFPCPMMKELVEIPLQAPLYKDPATIGVAKPKRNISNATVHLSREQDVKRYSLWTKDFSGLYPVFKIPSHQLYV